MKVILTALLAVALAVAGATPALAGEVVDGDGYSVRLPAGFEEALEIRKAGGMKVRARFGTMQIDGVPQVKAYIAGSHERPSATLLLSRVDLKRPVTTLNDLGMRQIRAMESRIPEGFEFQPRRIGNHDAIEMQFASEVTEENHTSRVLSVACGDYIVVMMLDTSDDRYRGDDTTWNELLASLKILPGRDGLVLVGLIGLGALLVLGAFVHVVRRYSGAGRDPLANRIGAPDGRSPSSTLSAYVEGASHAYRHTSSEGTRPPRRSAPAREGLRKTIGRDR